MFCSSVGVISENWVEGRLFGTASQAAPGRRIMSGLGLMLTRSSVGQHFRQRNYFHRGILPSSTSRALFSMCFYLQAFSVSIVGNE